MTSIAHDRDQEVPVTSAPPPPPVVPRRRRGLPDRVANLALGLASTVVLILAWQLLETTGVLDASVIPGPLAVARALGAGFGVGSESAPLLTDAIQTLIRLLCGLAIGGVVGIGVAVVAGVFRQVRDFLDPLVAVVNVIPAVITLPVVALWEGVGTKTIIIVTAYSAMIPVYRSAIDEIKCADHTLTWAAQSLGAGSVRYARSVVTPLTLVGGTRALRVALGYAWRATIAAEILVVAQQGLGSLTYDAHQFGNIATMLASLVTILVVGLALDLVASLVQTRFLRHRGLIGK